MHDAPEAAMRGFPPAPSSVVHAGNWFELPFLRWSLMNRSRMVRTAPVWCGPGPASALPVAGTDSLTGLTVDDGSGGARALDTALAALEIDGIMVLHRGQVVLERYFHGMEPHTQHGSASVSKSYLAVLAGILQAEGAIDLQRGAAHYVGELRGTGLGDATLQQLLDMQAALAPTALPGRDARLGSNDGGLYEIIGLMPPSAGSPRDFYEFVLGKDKRGEHGGVFHYDNAVPEALAWVLKRACGRPLSDLLSSRVFAPLGCERDGSYTVDATGAEFASGGLALALRDLARLGECLRCGGWFNGRQVVPAPFAAALANGGDRALFAQGRFVQAMPGWSYANGFYALHDEHDTFLASGRYGQRLVVAPRAEVVIAHFASSPGPFPHPAEREFAGLHRAVVRALA
jgi:CubicO group peptidase (beta-lactamase class C family)